MIILHIFVENPMLIIYFSTLILIQNKVHSHLLRLCNKRAFIRNDSINEYMAWTELKLDFMKTS